MADESIPTGEIKNMIRSGLSTKEELQDGLLILVEERVDDLPDDHPIRHKLVDALSGKNNE